jgi:hypothetical protein
MCQLKTVLTSAHLQKLVHVYNTSYERSTKLDISHLPFRINLSIPSSTYTSPHLKNALLKSIQFRSGQNFISHKFIFPIPSHPIQSHSRFVLASAPLPTPSSADMKMLARVRIPHFHASLTHHFILDPSFSVFSPQSSFSASAR